MKALNLEIGSEVYEGNSSYTILSYLNEETVVGRSHSTGSTSELNINHLTSEPANPNNPIDIIPKKELITIPDEEWKIAHEKAKVFRNILSKPSSERRPLIQKAAEDFKLPEITIYKQLKTFSETNSPLSLLRKNRSDKGVGRSQSIMEELIQEVITKHYLNSHKKSIPHCYDRLMVLAKKKEEQSEKTDNPISLKVPHINTFRNRIKDLTAAEKSKRDGSKGKDAHRPVISSFPEPVKPFDVVQIDHTPMDIIIVSEDTRLPIGRPTLTLAIDVYSRCVTGFYISLEKPSFLLLGACITHSVLDKSKWLNDRDIEGEWPSGLMTTVHCDNGKEMHSKALEKACDLHNINIEWRPVKTPRYGGHVERMFRTINNELHNLPGTTKSNVQDKGKDYDAEKNAALTLTELETWLANFIVNNYHQRLHSEIFTSPIAKYKQGVFGDDGVLPSGLPPRIQDEMSFKLDFLPFDTRTVQSYGIQINGVKYFHDVLRKWIKQRDRTRKDTQEFIVRYDPRDLSHVFFYDPKAEAYYPIPYKNTGLPAISLWELKEIKKMLKEKNTAVIDEEAVFEAKREMMKLVDNAEKETKATRRKKQKEIVRLKDSLPSQYQAKAAESSLLVEDDSDLFGDFDESTLEQY